jgi:hypothetical protein
MLSALFDVTILIQPSSFRLSFSKVKATASLTLRTSSSSSSYSMGKANPKISLALLERAKLDSKMADCSLTSQLECLSKFAEI